MRLPGKTLPKLTVLIADFQEIMTTDFRGRVAIDAYIYLQHNENFFIPKLERYVIGDLPYCLATCGAWKH
jgi:hypothetical protein